MGVAVVFELLSHAEGGWVGVVAALGLICERVGDIGIGL